MLHRRRPMVAQAHPAERYAKLQRVINQVFIALGSLLHPARPCSPLGIRWWRVDGQIAIGEQHPSQLGSWVLASSSSAFPVPAHESTVSISQVSQLDSSMNNASFKAQAQTSIPDASRCETAWRARLASRHFMASNVWPVTNPEHNDLSSW